MDGLPSSLQVARMSMARTRVSVCLFGERLLLAGGFNSHPLALTELFNPNTNSRLVRPMRPMNIPRDYAQGVVFRPCQPSAEEQLLLAIEESLESLEEDE